MNARERVEDPRDPGGLGIGIAYNPARTDLGLVYGIDCLIDDIVGRLTCANLWYQPGYGTDVNLLVNAASNPSAAVKAIDREIKKDNRVASCTTTYSFTAGVLTVTCAVVAVTGQRFSLVGALNTLDVKVFDGFQVTKVAA